MKANVFALSALLVGMTAGASAQIFTADFETNQAANFTVTIASSTNDAAANFTFDSSTHVQEAPNTNIPITAAPGSATTNVLQLTTNTADATDDSDAVSVYPNLTGLTGTDWTLIVDVWGNYNGGSGGGFGSTNSFMIGATDAKTVAPRTFGTATVTGNGFYFSGTIDGGNGTTDYRFYAGSAGTITNQSTTAPTIWGTLGGNRASSDTPWTTFFPSPAFETAGAPGKAWVTWAVRVVGGTATLKLKRPGDVFFTDVATATVPAAATNPFFGFSDQNANRVIESGGTAGDLGDQFLAIDNVRVFNGSAVVDWTAY